MFEKSIEALRYRLNNVCLEAASVSRQVEEYERKLKIMRGHCTAKMAEITDLEDAIKFLSNTVEIEEHV